VQIFVSILLCLLFLRIFFVSITKLNERKFSGNKYWGHNSWFSSCSISILESQIYISPNINKDYYIEIDNIIEMKKKSLLITYIEIKYKNYNGNNEIVKFTLNAPNIFMDSVDKLKKRRKLTTAST
jgi:hypothetical protein